MRTIPSLLVTALADSMLCTAQAAPTTRPAPKWTKPAAPTTAKSIAASPDIMFIDGVIYTGDADFILVDRDLYNVAALAILSTNVQQAFVAGHDALVAPDK